MSRSFEATFITLILELSSVAVIFILIVELSIFSFSVVIVGPVVSSSSEILSTVIFLVVPLPLLSSA